MLSRSFDASFSSAADAPPDSDSLSIWWRRTDRAGLAAAATSEGGGGMMYGYRAMSRVSARCDRT